MPQSGSPSCAHTRAVLLQPPPRASSFPLGTRSPSFFLKGSVIHAHLQAPFPSCALEFTGCDLIELLLTRFSRPSAPPVGATTVSSSCAPFPLPSLCHVSSTLSQHRTHVVSPLAFLLVRWCEVYIINADFRPSFCCSFPSSLAGWRPACGRALTAAVGARSHLYVENRFSLTLTRRMFGWM